MEKQQLWLLAGGNGAGKSTFYRMYLEPKGMPFVNADLLARQLFPDESEARSYEAAMIAGEIRAQLLRKGVPSALKQYSRIHQKLTSSPKQR